MDKMNTESVKNGGNTRIEKKPTFGWSLAVFLIVICILMFGIIAWGSFEN